MLKTKRKTLSRIRRGCWRNVYESAMGGDCKACGREYEPGRIVGCRAYPSKEIAEQEFLTKARINFLDIYLGAEFFPEK